MFESLFRLLFKYPAVVFEQGELMFAVSRSTALWLALIGAAANDWRETGFGPLDYGRTMRLVIPGVTLAVIGFQTILASFFLSVLGLRRR